jgi:AcrR family transcriptional regulator
MKASPLSPGTAPAAGHADRGAHAREQLIAHATRIFATKGYAAASTREICQAAGANVAAIHYYFGDKEALYRAVLSAPVDAIAAEFGRFADPALSFEEAMRHVLQPFVRMALTDDPQSQHVQRLHLREALEPSAVFRDVVDRIIVPLHNALVALLARHCGTKRVDEGLHQLAFAIVAMANDYCMSREFIRLLAPQVLDRDDAVERIVERLVGYSSALLAHELAARRGRRPDQALATATSTRRATAKRTMSRKEAR